MSRHDHGHPKDRPADGRETPAPTPPAGAASDLLQAGGEPQGKPALAPEELLAVKAEECRNLVGQLQRLGAEFSNYQKRAQRITEDERRRAVRDLVLDLLPAIDNFERALAAAEKAHEFKALLDGVRMVHGQMTAALAKHGIAPVEPAAAFDPEHHEAVAYLPSAEHPEGGIIEHFQKGYVMDGQVLRPGRVAVSRGRPEASAGGESAPEKEKDEE